MRIVMHRIRLSLIALVVGSSSAGQAQAGFLTQVSAHSFGRTLPDQDVWYQGSTSSSHDWTVSGPGTVSDGSASVSLLGVTAGIHLTASSHDVNAGITVAGQSLDVIRFVGPQANAPASLRLGVSVNGNVQVNLGGGLSASARLDVANLVIGSAAVGPPRGFGLPVDRPGVVGHWQKHI